MTARTVLWLQEKAILAVVPHASIAAIREAIASTTSLDAATSSVLLNASSSDDAFADAD